MVSLQSLLSLCVSLCIFGSAHASALVSLDADSVSEWLDSHNLGVFASKFRELDYDGEMLANFLREDELEWTGVEGATRAHVRKLFHRIEQEKNSRAEQDQPQARRSLSSTGSPTENAVAGIHIKRNNSGIVLGALGDTSLYRGETGSLKTDNSLNVQGLDVYRSLEQLAYGGLAWDFSHPGSKHFLRSAPDFVMPNHFTIETWVYPRVNDGGSYWLSWATEGNNNCMLLRASGFQTVNEWHHIVVTYDRRTMSIHDNGVVNMKLLHSNFCGDYTGSLVFGQEQDTVGGGYQWSQGTPMLLDTVAIYNRAFSEAERTTVGKTCINGSDPSLVTVWSGRSRGADQIGINQAELFFEGFATGASGNKSCSVEGTGEGILGDDYERYSVTHVTPAVGAVGWVFPGGDVDYHFLVEDLTLPLDFTLETWIYPLNSTAGTYMLSWAVPDNQNCFILKASTFLEVQRWHHFVVTWDGSMALVYVDGALEESYKWGEFCGSYTGSLSIGQEQDSVAGGYDPNQAPSMILDTVAIYSRAWDYTEVVASTSPCINLGDADLYALWSGYSRGKDLVGHQDGEVTPIQIISPGQSTVSASSYQWTNGDVEFDIEACQAAQDEVAALAPTYKDSTVGGVGWDFFGDSTAFYFLSPSDMTLPEEFTIEFWMYPRATQGYVLSWNSEQFDNCMLLRNSYVALNQWHHVVVVTSKNGFYDFTTTVYVNGTLSNNFLHSNFCGNHTGSLAIAQEQDSVGGSFDVTQATNTIIDTVAIYSVAWDADDVGTDREVGVDLQDPNLFALWSGYTKGRDLVGENHGEVWLYQFAEGMPNSDASVHTLDMLSPASVGGVGWDFPGSTTEYFIHTGNSFILPPAGFTIEMWVRLNSANSGAYLVSFADVESGNNNCILTQMSGFSDSDIGEWRHYVLTYDDDNDKTYAYVDGVNNQAHINAAFCGGRNGSLVIGQEQDALGGGFDPNQAADVSIDTVAVYSSYWDEDQVNARKGVCVNLHDTTLTTLWSGYTRGKDLVGNNHAIVNPSDWVLGNTNLDCTEGS